MELRNLELTAQERSILDALSRDDHVLAPRRARIVLAWADGQDAATPSAVLGTRIARGQGARASYVRRVISRFQEKRLELFSPAALKRAEGRIAAPAENGQDVISARSTMRGGARIILAQQFSKLQKAEAGVRDAEDAEAVHDMRVACRRMNSALRLFRAYLPKKRVKKLRGVMEELRDLLGEARNLDVLLEDLEKYAGKRSEQERAELEGMAEDWRTRRKNLQTDLVQLLDSAAFKTWGQRMDVFLKDEAKDDSPRVCDVVPALVWEQYGAVRGYERGFEDASLENLHALRIEIKRLRYTLEFFADAFPRKPKALIENLVTLQDELGKIQDAVVAEQELRGYLKKLTDDAASRNEPLPDLRGLAAYHAFLQGKIGTTRAHLFPNWQSVVKVGFRRGLGGAVAGL